MFFSELKMVQLTSTMYEDIAFYIHFTLLELCLPVDRYLKSNGGNIFLMM